VLDILAAIDAEGDAAAEPEAKEEADEGDEPAHATCLVLDTGGDESLAGRAVAEDRALRGDERLDGGGGDRDGDGDCNRRNSDRCDSDGCRCRGDSRISGVDCDRSGSGSRGDSRVGRVSRIGCRGSSSVGGVGLVASRGVVVCHFVFL